ncbi:LysR family transcriptional regulator [Hahella sp. CCB-MM4]|uniref:LysR family transcriptional regulator n=1 Tax=Hahella sp. (strain CCB-MM4) TaxID=1926491 RepID=UPI000B9A8C8E|nr:LysR family transcriptional regulator [Hahella sp. CCB-MM4]OZG70814.1 LysR family transcriptional regulator [Hahella sp. CCB-MM4]
MNAQKSSLHHRIQSGAQAGDWSDIYFAFQVARLGTLSAAAEVLDVHHSTVLRRINLLEKRLKTKLFHRHARGYSPTEAGKLLLQVATQTQEEFDRLMGQLSGIDEQLTGSLIVTTVNSYASVLIPLLAEFQELHPGIRIEFVADPRIFKLEYGEAHVSVRPGAKPKDPDHVVQPLKSVPYTLYASHKYIERFGRMKSREDIEGHRFVATVTPFNNVPAMAWLNKHVPEDQIYHRSSDFVSMMHAAESGLGIAAISCWLGDRTNQLTRLIEPQEEWESPLWLITHRDIHRTPKVQALTGFLKQRVPQL